MAAIHAHRRALKPAAPSLAAYFPANVASLLNATNAAFDTPNAFTYEMLLNIDPTQVPNGGNLVQRTNSMLFRLLFVTAGTPSAGFYMAFYNYNNAGPAYRTLTTTKLYPSTNYHVAMTFDRTLASNNLNYYVNGSLVGTFTDTVAVAAGSNLCLGGFSTDGGVRWRGVMDNFRAWNYARTASQISGSMSALLPESTSGLVACLGFNEVSGTDLLDSSPTNQPFSLVNTSITLVSSPF